MDAAALRVVHPQVHALLIRLDIVAELRLQGNHMLRMHACRAYWSRRQGIAYDKACLAAAYHARTALWAAGHGK